MLEAFPIFVFSEREPDAGLHLPGTQQVTAGRAGAPKAGNRDNAAVGMVSSRAARAAGRSDCIGVRIHALDDSIVENVEGLSSKLEVVALVNAELFGQPEVEVAVTGRVE